MPTLKALFSMTMAPCVPFPNQSFSVPSFVDHALQISIASTLVGITLLNETHSALVPLHDAPLPPVHSVHHLPQSLATTVTGTSHNPHVDVATNGSNTVLPCDSRINYWTSGGMRPVRSCNIEHNLDGSCLMCILHSLDWYGFTLLL